MKFDPNYHWVRTVPLDQFINTDLYPNISDNDKDDKGHRMATNDKRTSINALILYRKCGNERSGLELK